MGWLSKKTLLLNLNISYLHVFTYSERDNTEASMMKNSVQMNIRNQRSKLLRSLSEKKKRIFYNSQLNKTKSILFESENKFGYIHGFTDNYIKVRYPWDPKLSNRLVDAKLLAIDDEGYMRIAKVQESSKNDIKLSYSDSSW